MDKSLFRPRSGCPWFAPGAGARRRATRRTPSRPWRQAGSGGRGRAGRRVLEPRALQQHVSIPLYARHGRRLAGGCMHDGWLQSAQTRPALSTAGQIGGGANHFIGLSILRLPLLSPGLHCDLVSSLLTNCGGSAGSRWSWSCRAPCSTAACASTTRIRSSIRPTWPPSGWRLREKTAAAVDEDLCRSRGDAARDRRAVWAPSLARRQRQLTVRNWHFVMYIA